MFPATKPKLCVSAASLTSNVDADTVNTARLMVQKSHGNHNLPCTVAPDLESVDTMKVCRVCLAVSVKMYHTSEHKLSAMYEHVTGVEINTEDKLPKTLCWECVARLSSANNFKEKALKTQWILINKINSTGFVTINDIESIDRAQYQLESTLGVKFYKENDSSLYNIKESDKCEDNIHIENHQFYVKCEAEYCDSNDDIKIEEEQIIFPEVNITIENDPIKREFIETEENYVSDEDYKEADFSDEVDKIKFQNTNSLFETVEISIENINDTEMELIDNASNVNEKFDEASIKHSQNMKRWSMPGQVNRRSEASPQCKELSEDLEDIMLTSSKRYTHDSLKNMSAHSSKDSGIAHSQIKEEILEENNRVETITIYLPSVSTDTIGSQISFKQIDTKVSKNVFICDLCDKEFQNKSNLIRHVSNHPKVYSCNYCTYKAYARSTLSKHVNAKHTQRNVYNCSYCSHKAFYKGGLIRHVNAKHTKKEVYTCTLCDYTAHDKGILTRHVNAKHTKTNIYNCSYCDYQAYNKWNLSLHINVKHTKTKVYTCPHCSHIAYNKCALTRHVNAKHTKTNAYICSECSYKAFDKSCLIRHVNAIHTKTIAYNCSLCSYKAYLKSSLSRHVKSKHSTGNN